MSRHPHHAKRPDLTITVRPRHCFLFPNIDAPWAPLQ
jgi:hypothetical protein